jgi:hypothetical protein
MDVAALCCVANYRGNATGIRNFPLNWAIECLHGFSSIKLQAVRSAGAQFGQLG